jgi:hypothetical protein
MYGSAVSRAFMKKTAVEATGLTGSADGRTVYGVGYIIKDGIVYEDTVMSHIITTFPMYVLAGAYIALFWKYRRKTGNIFTLPISFFLLPILFFFGIFVFGNFFGFHGLISFIIDIFVPLYCLPLFLLTFVMACLVHGYKTR